MKNLTNLLDRINQTRYIINIQKEDIMQAKIFNSPFAIMQESMQEQLTQQLRANHWVDSPFAEIDLLKNDHSGKAGEVFVDRLCEALDIPKIFDEDIIATDGHYDIIMNGKQVEIKTARQGKGKERKDGTFTTGNFQHESLRNYGCDYWLFVDIAPRGIYLTVIDSSMWDLSSSAQHPILKIGAHSRHSTKDQYKIDTSVGVLKRGLVGGITLLIQEDTSFGEIKNFLNKLIN
tara:strand:- start:14 stop:712 length:699 start_codon:yes stop_codon:yes gene_type:complete